MKRPEWIDPTFWLYWLVCVSYAAITGLCSQISRLFRTRRP